ncbi:MAG: SDR family oxidoreductase [Lautropia sp.]|nr:SDR family oxidoreductase [Lautropia sp.]
MKIVITGASSGLGDALARELARRFPGSIMLLLARRADRLAALAAELPDVRCICESVDVTDVAGMQAVAQRFLDEHGAPDLVIASAGVSAGTLTDEPEDRAVFQHVFAINVQGVFDTFAPFVAPMRQAGHGTLVGIASVAGVRGLPGSGAYSGSKAAVSAYLESLRVELHGSGVSVVTISPGFIDTDMTRGNPYRMPFLMPAGRFAVRAVDAILARRRRLVIPWQMGWVALLLRCLPAWLFDRLFARAGRKPRQPALGRSNHDA